MGKYVALGRYLEKQEDASIITVTFDEVEEILGFDLPKSARKYRPWWANDQSHSHAVDGWLKVGWKTDNVDIQDERVEFVKSKEQKNLPRKSRSTKREEKPEITSDTTGKQFEEISRGVMSDYFDVESLYPRKTNGVPKMFDLVSQDEEIVGDAKFYSMVNGKSIPPAKFSAIAEYVWLLEKLETERKFLVFGNDKRVPKEWLKRYGEMNNQVDFYFINKDREVSKLNKKEEKNVS